MVVDRPADRPLLVTLELDGASFARLGDQRTRHFPPERNLVPAHLSLFHKLPAVERPAIESALAAESELTGPLPLRFPGVLRLGSGLAAVVEARGLRALHARLSSAFASWLTPQDRQQFRPHVTLMNKAPTHEAALAHEKVRQAWEPFEGVGEGLLLWTYLGGPWRFEARHRLGAG